MVLNIMRQSKAPHNHPREVKGDLLSTKCVEDYTESSTDSLASTVAVGDTTSRKYKKASTSAAAPSKRIVARTSTMDEVACRMLRPPAARKGISFSLSPRNRRGVLRTRSTDESSVALFRMQQKFISLDEEQTEEQPEKPSCTARCTTSLPVIKTRPSIVAAPLTRKQRPMLTRGGAFKPSKSCDASAYVSSRFLYESTRELMDDYDKIVDEASDSENNDEQTGEKVISDNVFQEYDEIIHGME
jgi:hypothetical protein